MSDIFITIGGGTIISGADLVVIQPAQKPIVVGGAVLTSFDACEHRNGPPARECGECPYEEDCRGSDKPEPDDPDMGDFDWGI